MTLWQEKHETLPLDDMRVSKYSILPSSTLAGVVGLLAGAGATSGNGCQGLAAIAGIVVASAISKQMPILSRK